MRSATPRPSYASYQQGSTLCLRRDYLDTQRHMEEDMATIRSVIFASLTLMGSTGATFAAQPTNRTDASQYISLYRDGDLAFPGLSIDPTTENQKPYDTSCCKGVYPWVIQSCGIK
jgi:hypothetical protein